MKKILYLSLIFILSIALLNGCTNKDDDLQEQQSQQNNETKESNESNEQINTFITESNEEKDLILEGIWTRVDTTATLDISNKTKKSFDFELTALSGANIGYVEGNAKIEGNNAYWNNEENDASITFRFKDDSLYLKTGGNINFYAGAGVVFKGKYLYGEIIKSPEKLVQKGILLNQEQEDKFKELVGDDYDNFLEFFQIYGEVENIDEFNAVAYSGGIRGLFTICEGIIMYDSENNFWAAIIGENSDTINYYTNTSLTNKLPKTIEKWRERFKDYKVYYIKDSKK